jgi:ATP-binding cassette, subfamily F, member 3
VLDDLGNLSPRSTQTELRNLLGCFLFSTDDVFKKIGVLSGGERNRYALLRLLLHPANFLLLDEPTNHLDLRAKDVLLKALSEYTGTVVFVSHDRYFIDRLATRVFEIGFGQVQVYPGNYEDYLWRKEQAGKALDGEPGAQGSGQAPTGEPKPSVPELLPGNGKQTSGPDARAKRLNPIKRKQMEERCQDAEQEIARLEAQIAQCETALQTFVSTEETVRLTQELNVRRAQLASLLAEWEELGQALEEDLG